VKQPRLAYVAYFNKAAWFGMFNTPTRLCNTLFIPSILHVADR
jgi:hypothetical protein